MTSVVCVLCVVWCCKCCMISAVFEKLEQKTGNCNLFVIFTTVLGVGRPRSLRNSMGVSVFQSMPAILVSYLEKISLRQFL